MRSKILNLLAILSICGLIYCSYGWYKIDQQIKLLDAINARIHYLHYEEGYSFESAKHIAEVEFKIIPPDEQYKALIED